MSFFARVEERQRALQTALVLGVDPHLQDLPEPTAEAALAWSMDLVAAVGPQVVAIKPNSAFFEQLPGGMEALRVLIESTGLPVILDGKRGDIGSTAEAYASSAYDDLGADAVTVQPYLGRESVQPFLRPGKAVFVLCRTSNPGAAALQELPTQTGPLYERVASMATGWSPDVGLVVGATCPDALANIRARHPDTWLLCPGVGAQGASPEQTLSRAPGRTLVPISRGISRASDPVEAARHFASALRQAPLLARPGNPWAQALVAAGCVQHGTFTLRSGATSNVYVDCRTLIGHPALLGALAAALSPHVGGAQRIAGVPTAGLPLGTALSLHTGVPMVYPRSEAKAHGTTKRVEGPFSPGDTVVLVDDVATSGISLVNAAVALREAGLRPTHALVLVEREGEARAWLAREGITLVALLHVDALGPDARGA